MEASYTSLSVVFLIQIKTLNSRFDKVGAVMKNTSIHSTLGLFILSCAALVFAGCGPSGDSSSSSGGSSSSAAPAAETPGAVSQTIELTANDQMKFNLERFAVKVGSTVKIHLKNVGSMPKMSMGHNVVVLKQGTDEKAFVEAAIQAPANDYIPQAQEDAVIAHTKMLGGGEDDSVTFKVPSKKGNYTFLCSFPGHFQVGMKGTMIVN
jgi:azurin